MTAPQDSAAQRALPELPESHGWEPSAKCYLYTEAMMHTYARAAIEQERASHHAVQQEGWVMVPEFPTPEMVNAGGFSVNMNYHYCKPETIAVAAYTKMLSVAPPAPNLSPETPRPEDVSQKAGNGDVSTVEQAIAQLVTALAESKGWMRDYADSIIRDAIDRKGLGEAAAAPEGEVVPLVEYQMLRAVYEEARRVLRYMGVDADAVGKALDDMDAAIEQVKNFDGGNYEPQPDAPPGWKRTPNGWERTGEEDVFIWIDWSERGDSVRFWSRAESDAESYATRTGNVPTALYLHPAHPGEALEAQERDAATLARQFHEAYERLAPSFGYETREETRTFDPDSANGKLMIAVCAALSAGGRGGKS